MRCPDPYGCSALSAFPGCGRGCSHGPLPAPCRRRGRLPPLTSARSLPPCCPAAGQPVCGTEKCGAFRGPVPVSSGFRRSPGCLFGARERAADQRGDVRLVVRSAALLRTFGGHRPAVSCGGAAADVVACGADGRPDSDLHVGGLHKTNPGVRTPGFLCRLSGRHACEMCDNCDLSE